MNSIGRNPTEVELAEIVTQMDTDGNGTLDVNEFMSLMARKFKEADTMEEVLESFKARARSTRGPRKSEVSAGLLELLLRGSSRAARPRSCVASILSRKSPPRLLPASRASRCDVRPER